jgi:hypothetical protein
MNERRKFPRFTAKWRLKYQLSPEETPVEQEVIDISGGGIRFRSDYAIEPGTTVTIELEPDPLPATILASAKVVWCRRIDRSYEVGAFFQWCKRTDASYEVGAQFLWIGWKDEVMNQGEIPDSDDFSDLFSGETDAESHKEG